MLKRWLVLALTLYLSLDVANPLMPGAVTFGIDPPSSCVRPSASGPIMMSSRRYRCSIAYPASRSCDEVMTTGLVLHDRASAAEGAVHGTITSAADRAAS
jgi:hypothetical protein